MVASPEGQIVNIRGYIGAYMAMESVDAVKEIEGATLTSFNPLSTQYYEANEQSLREEQLPPDPPVDNSGAPVDNSSADKQVD